MLLAHFEDARGGFFFTADDHERLIHKPKPFADEAVPSGNGVAAWRCSTLGHLLGEQRYLDAAERTVRAALHGIERYPEAHATLLRALDELLDAAEARRAARHRAGPRAVAAPARRERYVPPASARVRDSDDATGLRGLLAQRTRASAGGVAYVCEGMTCRAPITAPSSPPHSAP